MLVLCLFQVGGTLPEMTMESIFQQPFHSSSQHSPIGIEQEASFTSSPFLNAYFRNENNLNACYGNESCGMQTQFETTEEEDEFVNSMLVDGDIFIREEKGHAFVNGPSKSESLTRVYYESSDTDAEVVSALVKIYCPKTK